MSNSVTADWIAIDWGTSQLRGWAMDGEDQILGQRSSGDGMATLARDGFEPALLQLVDGWLTKGRKTPVICCGMVGSRQGWVEAPYQTAPCAPMEHCALVQAPATDSRLDVRVISGIKQVMPADVMRGEETQVAGLLAKQPTFDGVICLPGTHSKWVHVQAGEIVSFQTFLTGELFSLLGRRSVLSDFIATDGWDDAAFDAALTDSLSKPGLFAARLFSLRANGLILGADSVAARAHLSGLLIGLELGAARPYWLGRDVVVLGADDIAQVYLNALRAQGVEAQKLDGQDLTLAGLGMAHRKFAGPKVVS